MYTAGQTIPRYSRDVARNAENSRRDVPSPRERGQAEAPPDPKNGDSQSQPRADVPTDDQVEAALAKALKSAEFQSAPQLRSFLGFVVHATLNKKKEKIKGYTIAVEALGRPDDFNPVVDPIVRVEAARLRRRLEKYYAGSGAQDPVYITIPKGSYAPAFHRAGSGPAAGTADKLSAFDGGDTLVEAGPAPESASFQLRADIQAAGSGSPQRAVAAVPGPGTAGSLAGAPEPDGHGQAARDLTGRLRALRRQRVSLWLVLAVGTGCFVAGFLAASF